MMMRRLVAPWAVFTALIALIATTLGVATAATSVLPAAAAGTPVVTKLTPNTGRPSGGTVVTISGSGFTGATGVTFGGRAATAVAVQSDTSIVATAPAGTTGQSAVVVTAPGGASATSAAAKFTYTLYDHIFIVPMENQNYSDIIGSNNGDPYINGLANTYGLATNYHGTDHPSLANYLALVGGTDYDSNGNDCDPTGSCIVSGANLASNELDPAGLSWKGYMESMGNACRSSDNGEYAVRHDPFPYFKSLQGTAECQANVVDYSHFSGDMSSLSTTANYVWITPNLISDMHDGSIQDGDNWLSQNLPIIFNSPAWTQTRSMMMMTWDEDAGSDNNNQVATIVATSAPAFHATSNVNYDHYSLLKTVESTWGLGTMASGDGGASPMTDLLPPASITPPPPPPPPAQPTLASVSPATGPSGGGTRVTIAGTALAGATAVTFGGVPAASVVVNAAGTQITATTPAGSGTVDIVVTTPGGTASLPASFTYAPPAPPPGPTLASVNPTSGPNTGGTAVTIAGTNLSGATSVTFGGTPAIGVSVNGGGTGITATTPAGSGTVAVAVTTPAGSATLPGAFTYTTNTPPPPPTAPTISGVSPPSGDADGGTPVTITGTNLTGATSVTFGGAPAGGISINAAGTRITATTPAGSGTVDVSVTTPAGTATLPNGFTYSAPPPPGTPRASGTIFATDTFAGRTVSGGWGTTTAGQSWTVQTGSPTALSVSGGEGILQGSSSLGTERLTLGTATAADAEVVDRYTSGAYGSDTGHVLLRFSSPSSYYSAGLDAPVSGSEINIMRTSGGVESRVANVAFPTVTGTAYWQRVRITTAGSAATIQVRVWADGTSEPSTWNLSYTDTSPLPAGSVGVEAWDNGSGWRIDNFSAGNLSPGPPPPPATSAPVFTADSPATTAVVGQPYSYTFAASGSPAPSFTASGTLPPGLTLGSGGALSGTPTSAGSFAFTVVASNSAGTATSAAHTITVAPSASGPVFTADTPLTVAFVDVPYAYTYAASGSPAPTFSLGSGTLPPGLTLGATGTLAGTPTTLGTFAFDVVATNPVGSAHSATTTVTVGPTPAVPIAAGAPVAEDSFAGRTATGGWGTSASGQAWTLQSGSASVLSVANNTGQVHGSGSMATARLTLNSPSVTDAEVVDRYTSGSYNTDAGHVMLRFSSPTTFYAAGLDSPVSGAEINVMRESGGAETRVANAAFPAVNGTSYWQRVRITTAGTTAVIQVRAWADGTPEPSTWNLTYTDNNPLRAGVTGVEAWDGGGGWAIDHFSAGDLTAPVADSAPVITADSPPTAATVGTAYTYTFTASGSPAPAFSLVRGSLPPGLSLSPSGVLSGTPTQPGSYSFILRVGNKVKVVASNSHVITVAPYPMASGTIIANDTFQGRTLTGGWGTASDGHLWTQQSGVSSVLSVAGNSGQVHGSSSMATARVTLNSPGMTDTEVVDRYTSGSYNNDAGHIVVRFSGTSTFYAAGLDSPVSGAEINVMRASGGGEARVAAVAFPAVNGTSYWQRVRITTAGSSATIQVKIWTDGTPEPATWNLTYTDSNPLPAGTVGVEAWDGGGGWAITDFTAGSLG
ncbi:MAG TPA: IPT/TIG domain-containing protein [Actinomycetota bacterium]|nr:IPT/TIG domain-containing protein [Actinomycetota bacterium]